MFVLFVGEIQHSVSSVAFSAALRLLEIVGPAPTVGLTFRLPVQCKRVSDVIRRVETRRQPPSYSTLAKSRSID